MMIFLNEVSGLETMPRKLWTPFVLLLSPYAPHLAEELWEKLGHAPSISRQPWPTWDEALTAEELVEVVFQINGKIRAKESMPPGTAEAELKEKALGHERIKELLQGKEIRKVIVVPEQAGEHRCRTLSRPAATFRLRQKSLAEWLARAGLLCLRHRGLRAPAEQQPAVALRSSHGCAPLRIRHRENGARSLGRAHGKRKGRGRTRSSPTRSSSALSARRSRRSAGERRAGRGGGGRPAAGRFPANAPPTFATRSSSDDLPGAEVIVRAGRLRILHRLARAWSRTPWSCAPSRRPRRSRTRSSG